MGRDNKLGIWGGDGWAIPCQELRGLHKNGGGGGGSDCSIGVGAKYRGWISRIMVVPIVSYTHTQEGLDHGRPMVERGGGDEGSARK